MCGIAGFSLRTDEDIDSRKLGNALLTQIVTRGTHATGMAFVTGTPENRKIKNFKAPVNAFDFIKSYSQNMPTDTKTAIFHTRFATLGSPLINLNNHPIRSESVVGVHNGHVINHREIFRDYSSYERKAQVDSEAIFSMLASYDKPTEVLGLLEGGAAIAWLDTRTGVDLNIARCCNSPLAVGQTNQGSFIFASTSMLLGKGVKDAGIKLDWLEELPEWVYMRVRRGRVLNYEDIVQYESEAVMTKADILALELSDADHAEATEHGEWTSVDMWGKGW
jgi:glucosamine 6-phosphate synthetase-like amidotransferase/phosphosugar isomerase protein